jgi:hypothetical protein
MPPKGLALRLSRKQGIYGDRYEGVVQERITRALHVCWRASKNPGEDYGGKAVRREMALEQCPTT